MNLLKKKIDEFRAECPALEGLSDDALFSALCAKYFFFAEPRGGMFSAEGFCDALTDGTRDCGIDALFRNPDGEAQEIVILQSKYYGEHNALTARRVKCEMDKIVAAIDNIRHGRFSSFNSRVRQAYNVALEADSDADITWRVAFMTSWKPMNDAVRAELIRTARAYADDRIAVEMHFEDDIEAEIEDFGREEEFCERGELKLFGKARALKYGKAVVVNVSARSLAHLARKKHRAILGMNLRYHISSRATDRKLDEGMLQTMRTCPENFWYYNNGLVIVCRDGFTMTRDGRLQLRQFSIVNGGQTTENIKSLSQSEGGAAMADFPVLCRVIKAQGRGEKGKLDFCNDIAEHTNSQKPISQADLKANREEQKALQARLRKAGVFYIRKAGDVPAKTFHPWQVAGLERIGQLGLAAVMLMPAEARNRHAEMFVEGPYNAIFKARVPGRFYADLLLLSRCYQDFRRMVKGQRGGSAWFDEVGVDVVAHAESFVLASIAYILRVDGKVMGRGKYRMLRKAGDREALCGFCAKLRDIEGILSEETVERVNASIRDHAALDIVFREICQILESCYKEACTRAGEELDVSAYFKKADVFHAEITDRLYRKCHQPSSALMFNWRKCMA